MRLQLGLDHDRRILLFQDGRPADRGADRQEMTVIDCRIAPLAAEIYLTPAQLRGLDIATRRREGQKVELRSSSDQRDMNIEDADRYAIEQPAINLSVSLLES